MDGDDAELSLGHVELAESQFGRHVGLPVGGVEERGSGDALVKHQVRVFTELHGHAGGDGDEDGGQRVASVIEQFT